MLGHFVITLVTDTAQPAMTELRSFAVQDNVKLLTTTEYNCTVHMFRQLVLKPVTDTAQPAMTELRNFAEQAADSYTTIPHVAVWQSVLNFTYFLFSFNN